MLALRAPAWLRAAFGSLRSCEWACPPAQVWKCRDEGHSRVRQPLSGSSKTKHPECGNAQTRPSGKGNLLNIVGTLDRIENPISTHTVADAPVRVYRTRDIRAIT